MTPKILIYGATGYTADLVIRHSLQLGGRPLLAARSGAKLAPIAQRHGLFMRSFSLEDDAAIFRALRGVRVVLNCAGPFSRTAMPLAKACIEAKVHYLDVAGELAVFESLATLAPAAAAAGVLLLPGAGFDVVASDCLAGYLKRCLPDASHLTLALRPQTQLSRGTAITVVENLDLGGYVRRDGKLCVVPTAWATRRIDFGAGPVVTLSVPWSDLHTAWRSTGIPNIEFFLATPAVMRWMAKATRQWGDVLGSRYVQNLLTKSIAAWPAGPAADERNRSVCSLWGEVLNSKGEKIAARLHTGDVYTLTAQTAWDLAQLAFNGLNACGIRTPSMLMGHDYILKFSGCNREIL